MSLSLELNCAGDHKQYQGRILAYKADTKRHLVLWEDGEDEWVDVGEEELTWHCDRGKSSGFSTGLPVGEDLTAIQMLQWSCTCQRSIGPAKFGLKVCDYCMRHCEMDLPHS